MEELQITGLTEKDYESVNKAYHKLHEEHVKGRPDIYTDTRELLTKEEFQEIVKSKEYVAVGAKKTGRTGWLCDRKEKGDSGKSHAEKESYFVY